MLVSSACVLSITDYTAPTPPLKVKKAFEKQKAEWWSKEKRKTSFDRWLCDWAPSSVNVGHAHRFIRLFWGHMCLSVCLIYGKTIQSDNHKSPTFFFPFPLCLNSTTSGIVTALCNWYREDMLSELQPRHFLYVLTLRLVMFHVHLCNVSTYIPDRKLWGKKVSWCWIAIETANICKWGIHIHIFISMLVFFTSCCHYFTTATLKQLCQTRVSMKVIDKQQKCQMR